MKYYLIDYENVNASGLDGIENLTTDCRIVLFYTRNSSKIDLGVFNRLRNTEGELAVIEVHHGKQALDIQLASYVGFLIGTEPADTEYYIVSKDKGYRNIQDFWSDRRIVLCTSLQVDSEIIEEPKPARSRSSSRGGRRTETADKAGAAERSGADESSERTEGKNGRRPSAKKGFQTKAEKNSKREKYEHRDESAAVPESKTAETVTDRPVPAGANEMADELKAGQENGSRGQSTVKAKADEPETSAKDIPNAFAEAAALAAAMAKAKNEGNGTGSVIVKNAPAGQEAKAEEAAPSDDQADTADETKAAKKPAKKTRSRSRSKSKAKSGTASDDTAEGTGQNQAEEKAGPKKAGSRKTEINTEIQKILSKEDFPGDLINATASFVSKNIDKEGSRQQIYRGIIKEHGQKQGLAIYRLIKGIL